MNPSWISRRPPLETRGFPMTHKVSSVQPRIGSASLRFGPQAALRGPSTLISAIRRVRTGHPRIDGYRPAASRRSLSSMNNIGVFWQLQTPQIFQEFIQAGLECQEFFRGDANLVP